MDKDEMRAIVREEINNEKLLSLLLKALNGDKNNVINTFINDQKERFREKFNSLPGEIQRHTGEYLDKCLEKRVKSVAAELLPELVKLQVIDRLSHLSGVQQLIETHNGIINSILHEQAETFNQTCKLQKVEISNLQDQYIKEFKNCVEITTNSVIKTLVGDGGLVIKAYKDELAKQNEDNFKTTENWTRETLRSFVTEIHELKNKSKKLEVDIFWLGVLSMGILVVNGFTIYKILR